jgi:hypothetical protein
VSATEVLTGTAVTRSPSLLRAEVLRIRSRRLVRLLLALGYAVIVVAFVITAFNTGNPSAAERSAAQTQADQLAAQCRADPNVPTDQKDQVCSGFTAEQFLRTRPFDVSGLSSGALAVAAGFAALAFIIGASSGGAEWTAKTLPSLLTWEPRRVRVSLTKVAVVAATVVLATVLAELLWTGLGSALVSLRGSWSPRPDRLWGDLLDTQLRAVLLAGLAGAAGFAVANLIRNTGAALGLAFVYFAVVENAVRVLWHWGQQWLVMENVTALVQRQGVDLVVSQRLDPATGSFTSVVVHLTNLRAGLTLAGYTAAAVLVAVLVFRRRDLT